MSTALITLSNPDEIRTLFGAQDVNLRRIREAVGVSAVLREDVLTLEGDEAQVRRGQQVVEKLQSIVARSGTLTETDVLRALELSAPGNEAASPIDLFEKAKRVAARTPGQAEYIEAIRQHDLVFCRGPAGCGKTYLAVAMAVNAIRREQVRKIVLVRPAVEAGERLGFLPGDLLAKVNPFLRPLLDAMQEMLDFDQVRRYMEADVVEIVPLAFMRGRTLNQTFIILDEGQNTTVTQMKMFLTRMGEGSKIVVTGDVTQVDLPPNIESGMMDAMHRLVREIVEAYDTGPRHVVKPRRR